MAGKASVMSPTQRSTIPGKLDLAAYAAMIPRDARPPGARAFLLFTLYRLLRCGVFGPVAPASRAIRCGYSTTRSCVGRNGMGAATLCGTSCRLHDSSAGSH